MRFYAETNSHELLFSEKDIIKAIFTAWNFHADLWLVDDKAKYSDLKKYATIKKELLFTSCDPFCNNKELEKYKVKVIEPTEPFPNTWDIAVRHLGNGIDYYFEGGRELKEKK